jgi:DNA-binding MarR family transcriptional regulator
MTSTLQRLEERGFIRLDPDLQDARRKRVMLTPDGRARREQAVRGISADLGPVAARMGGVRGELLPALTALRQALDRARED